MIMNFHISTFDTFKMGSMKSTCPVCKRDGKIDYGYVGCRCSTCKSQYDPSESWRGDIVKMRRQLMGMNRKQFGLLTGYSPKTIKRYEYVKCSKKYYDLTTKLILNHELSKPKNQQQIAPGSETSG